MLRRWAALHSGFLAGFPQGAGNQSVLEGVMANKKKGKSTVTVYPDWCKGCGICVEFCPSKVFVIGDQGKATVVNEKDCIHCGFCELHCPDFAIVVRDKTPGTDGAAAEEPAASAPAKAATKGKGA